MLAHETDVLKRCTQAFLGGGEVRDFYNLNDEDGWEPFLNAKPKDVLKDDFIFLARTRLGKIEPRWAQHMSEMKIGTARQLGELRKEDKQLIRKGLPAVLRNLINDRATLVDIVTTKLDDPELVNAKDRVVGREIELLTSQSSWRIYLAVSMIEIYNRLVKSSGYGRKNNTGWSDNKQAIYLATTDVFVTEDKAQMKVLRIAAKFSDKRVQVWSLARLEAELAKSPTQ